LSSSDALPRRERWARLRFAIIGPLLAAPPDDGDLHEALNAFAAKTWRHPFTGVDVRFACSTLAYSDPNWTAIPIETGH
jgi:hypothetical protein